MSTINNTATEEAQSPTIISEGQYGFSTPRDGIAKEYKKVNNNWVMTGRSFGTDSEYFKRIGGDSFSISKQEIPRPAIDRSIGKNPSSALYGGAIKQNTPRFQASLVKHPERISSQGLGGVEGRLNQFKSTKAPTDGDPLGYYQWLADENQRRADFAKGVAKETQEQAQNRWNQLANERYAADLSKGIESFEEEVKADADSETNKKYGETIKGMNAERDEEFRKMESELSGLNPAQRRVFESYRRNLIMSKYDKNKGELDRYYDESIKNDALGKYEETQNKIVKYKTLSDDDRLKLQKEEAIEEHTKKVMERWNTENPDNQINKWQAEKMAKDELFADPTKVNNTKALNELRLTRDSEGLDKFGKSMEITNGNVSEARTFWLKYLPKMEVDKQEEAYWESKGYTKEQAKKAVTESDIVHLLMKPDEELTVEDIQNLDTYQVTNTESFDEAVWKLEQKKDTGKLPSATEVYKYRNQIQSNAAVRKAGTGTKDTPKTESDKLYIETVLPLIKSREDIINGYITNDYTSEWGSLTNEEKNSMSPADKLQFIAIKTKQVPERMKSMMLKAFDEQQAHKEEMVTAPSNDTKNAWTSSLVKLGGAASKSESAPKAGTMPISQFDSLWESTK